MQKKVEEKRKELENKTDGAGSGGAGGGVSDHKQSVSSRQSSATNTPRNIRYTYYTTNVGSLACFKYF